MIAQGGTLEISAGRLRSNVELFRKRLGGGKGAEGGVCATVKANAYGHGLAQVVPVLWDAGVRWGCVYSLAEALDVLKIKPELNVLVLAPVVVTDETQIPGATLKALVAGQVRISLNDKESALRLAQMLAVMHIERPVKAHVQVDTGLTRAGVDGTEAAGLIETIEGLGTLELEGVFSHLSHGDVPGHETVERQVERLRAVADPVKKRLPRLLVHLQNSGGAWHGRDWGLDMLRVGIGLYGLQPSFAEPIAELKPIARLVAPILAIHERPAGVGVGYGHTFVTKRASRLAIVPVGYGDGYPRALSNRGVVQLDGKESPVVGRVSMDQIIVDVTELPDVIVGDEVVVISNEAGDGNCVDRIAEVCGTIGYEIATGLGHRLDRKFVD